MTLRLIINCGPCEDFIGRSIDSVRSQSMANWKAYVTVDPCGDDTFMLAVKASSGDVRFEIHRNTVRRFSLPNQIAAIRRMNAAPEDVIISLDGDDWFATDDALRIIADTYEREDCWLTYGSWVQWKPDTPGLDLGMWPAYPDGTADFRHTRWLGTAVRTWKKWL